MKTEVESAFKPIKVTLILETVEEASALYNIVNHLSIGEASGLEFYKLREELKQYRDENSWMEFCKFMKEHS